MNLNSRILLIFYEIYLSFVLLFFLFLLLTFQKRIYIEALIEKILLDNCEIHIF